MNFYDTTLDAKARSTNGTLLDARAYRARNMGHMADISADGRVIGAEPSRHPGRSHPAAGHEPVRFVHTNGTEDATLHIEGQLHANTAPALRPVFDALITKCPRQVTVDLSGLELIDSSGLGEIVWLFKRVRAYGGALRLLGTQGQPLVIFKLLRLDRVFAM